MDAHELYLNRGTMEKEAFLGMALRTAANVVTLPGLGSLAGQLTRGAGRMVGAGKFNPSFGQEAARLTSLNHGVQTVPKNLQPFTGGGIRANVANKIHGFGSTVDRGFGKVDMKIKDFMNKGPVLGTYDPSKWNPTARGIAQFVGMDTRPGVKNMTMQRAAVWGGNALVAKDTAQGFMPQKQPQPIKQAAQAQADTDFDALVAYLEGR